MRIFLTADQSRQDHLRVCKEKKGSKCTASQVAARGHVTRLATNDPPRHRTLLAEKVRKIDYVFEFGYSYLKFALHICAYDHLENNSLNMTAFNMTAPT